MQTPTIAAAPHGQRRLLPGDAWDGKAGDMLRALGMSPDDESNLVPNRASQSARLDEGRAALAARTRRANEELANRVPGGELNRSSFCPTRAGTARAATSLC